MSAEQRTIDELREALDLEGAFVLDVRTGGEFAGGHIEGALNIPLHRLTDTAELEAHQPLWIICRSGTRSAKAAAQLAARGLTVRDVSAGMIGWRRAGLPTVGSSRPRLIWPVLACLTLGIAPFSGESHLVGKLRWVAGGAEGMAAMDWLDLLLHGSPWIWLVVVLLRRLR